MGHVHAGMCHLHLPVEHRPRRLLRVSVARAPPPGGTPLRVMCYRTDNAGELTSKEAVRHFHKQLIKRELSVPDCSVQNALAETAIVII